MTTTNLAEEVAQYWARCAVRERRRESAVAQRLQAQREILIGER